LTALHRPQAVDVVDGVATAGHASGVAGGRSGRAHRRRGAGR
jgi:hypothetical protein